MLPVFALFLKGQRRGLGWVCGLFAGLAMLIVAQHAGWVRTTFTTAQLIGLGAPLLL